MNFAVSCTFSTRYIIRTQFFRKVLQHYTTRLILRIRMSINKKSIKGFIIIYFAL